MGKENLQKYLREMYPMPEEKAVELTGDFTAFSFSKGTFLLEENKVNQRTYFLESGFVRSFTHDSEGNEVTTNIYTAPCFVNDFLSFFKRQPAKQNFQALTDCSGWTMTYADEEIYFNQYPEFREFGRILVLHHFDLLQQRTLELIQESAENRYVKLLSEHPEIFQNVSLKIIASYLGITDTSLSRIRKEICQK
ncbi:MAG TPA: Crp/Fnr family transcriptional regulator [Prolixibacteraceae bacterium]|nr:Crp/Fnr family transcriptional regulator [Prolixibacteraceae bacterium]HPS13243.1 Crp/Fnr family transcriptional regulator [Prolixibacteraceae bacterium]